MKSGKAQESDGVSAVMLNAGREIIVRTMIEIFEGIWEIEKISGDWMTGLIIKLPNKGDLSMCNNWRGITLLSVTRKVFSRVILDRISAAIDPLMRKEQAVFRKGRYCGEHICTLRQIMVQCQEWNSQAYTNVVDFEKAFDIIHRDSLALRNLPKIVNIIKLHYGDFRSKVTCGQSMTEDFEIKTDRQGYERNNIINKSWHQMYLHRNTG